MTVEIQFSTDNAAFEDNGREEIEAMLKRCERALSDNGQEEFVLPLYDTNGNKVGKIVQYKEMKPNSDQR